MIYFIGFTRLKRKGRPPGSKNKIRPNSILPLRRQKLKKALATSLAQKRPRGWPKGKPRKFKKPVSFQLPPCINKYIDIRLERIGNICIKLFLVQRSVVNFYKFFVIFNLY